MSKIAQYRTHVEDNLRLTRRCGVESLTLPSPDKTVMTKVLRSPDAGEFFNSISASVLRDFLSVVVPVYCPGNAVLFQEQQPPTRILVLLEGFAKISVNSSEGRRMILWVARSGELLGLSSVLSGSAHKVTAETLQPCRIASVPPAISRPPNPPSGRLSKPGPGVVS